jgi:hypothetical protein
MKKRIFYWMGILSLTLLPQIAIRISANATSATAAPVQSKEFKKTVDLENGGDFALNTDKGSVRLTSWNNNQVEIYARIDPPENEDADYGRRSVEGARIDVTGSGRSITVRSNFEGVPEKDSSVFNHSKALPNIHYEIRAPRNLNLRLNVDRSKLDVQGFNGKIRVETDRSPLTASDLEGDLEIKIDRGTVNLRNLRGSFSLDADRTEGQLNLLHLTSDSRIQVDRGNFDVSLAAAQGLNLVADLSKRASFNSDFQVAMPPAGKGRDRVKFEEAINGGGPRLVIEADRGNIHLKRD